MELFDGEGWRLRVEPARQPFPVLIGGSEWGAELSASEALILQQGVATLVSQLRSMASWLMPEETVELEFERDGLWLQMAGRLDCWCLRFVLNPVPLAGSRLRGLEGSWGDAASAALAGALEAVVIPAQDIRSSRAPSSVISPSRDGNPWRGIDQNC